MQSLINKEFEMEELTLNEIEQVNGGRASAECLIATTLAVGGSFAAIGSGGAAAWGAAGLWGWAYGACIGWA
ncbi:class IIb bacteriocin, lactobin A/cerein 7B family [Shewanella sp. 0m-11]